MSSLSGALARMQALQHTSWTDSGQSSDDEEPQLFSTQLNQMQIQHPGLQAQAQMQMQQDDEETHFSLANKDSQSSIVSDISSPSAVGPPLPQVINIQQRIDHAIHIHVPTDYLTSTTPADILFSGLIYAGFEPKVQQRNNVERNIDRFKSFYGVEPSTAAPLLRDLKDDYQDISFKDCLMTMNWLNLYDTYPVLSGRWKCCEETIGSKVINTGMKLAAIGEKKIVFHLAHDVVLGRTVDATTFMVYEMRQDPSNKWFDYKTHSCGLKYEIATAIHESRIVWINGPFPASVHDINIFRGGDAGDEKNWDKSALRFKLRDGEKCIADSGYGGDDKCVVVKYEHSSEFKEFAARAKNRQEVVNWRLKTWNILRQRFRHGVGTNDRMRLHKMAVMAVAGIVQYDFENGHPLFEVK